MTDSASAHEFSSARYDQMQYRRCGRSGLKLSVISLGAWETFGGYRGEEVAKACMFRAFDLGITHFDFANNYGKPPGNAELVGGRIIRQMPRDELIINPSPFASIPASTTACTLPPCAPTPGTRNVSSGAIARILRISSG